MSHRIIFSNEQKELIIHQYLVEKLDICKIAPLHNISVTPIESLLHESGVKIRGNSERQRHYLLNENYFDKIDSPDKAYFFGFLMADGYNSQKRGVIELACSAESKDILDRLNLLIGSNKPLHIVNGYYHIEWCSKKLSDDLFKLGCMQAKSLKIKFPEFLEGDLIRHFMRGFFDGDGCFSYSLSEKDNYFGSKISAVVTFTSTEDMCLYIKKYFQDNFNVCSSMTCRHPENNNNNRTITISGQRQVIKIMEWMYKDADLYMKRKYDDFITFSKIREERLKIVSKCHSEIMKRVGANYNRERKERIEKKKTVLNII